MSKRPEWQKTIFEPPPVSDSLPLFESLKFPSAKLLPDHRPWWQRILNAHWPFYGRWPRKTDWSTFKWVEMDYDGENPRGLR